MSTSIEAWDTRRVVVLTRGSPLEWENRCVETYETMHNSRNDVWWNYRTNLGHIVNGIHKAAKLFPKRTTLGRVNFAPRVGALRNCQG